MEITSRLVDAAIAYGVIRDKDEAIYTLAVSSLLFSLFTWGTLLVLGILFLQVQGCMIFLLFHVPLRVYAGGFHQNSRIKCYIQSLVIFGMLIISATSELLIWSNIYWSILAAPAAIIIWFLSPVETSAKPLNLEERKHHRLTARIILIVEIFILIFFSLNHFERLLYFAVFSVEIVAVQLIFGIVADLRLLNKNTY